MSSAVRVALWLSFAVFATKASIHDSFRTYRRPYREIPSEGDCVDKAPNCFQFSLNEICKDPDYHDWAKQYCRNACGFCASETPVVSTKIAQGVPALKTTKQDLPRSTSHASLECKDKLNNCHEYQSDSCTKPSFHSWANENCQRFCGFCQGNPTLPPATNATTTHPDGACFDRADCGNYDIRTSCCGPYERWARYNCAKHCTFCTPPVTEAPICHDTDTACDRYNADLCTNMLYEGFVKEHCAGFCKVCETPQYIPPCTQASVETKPTKIPTTTVAGISSSPGACEDHIDCSGYDVRTACCSPYEQWARSNCRKHCKFCVPEIPEARVCQDIDTMCDQYGSDLCTTATYDRFVKESCAGTCKVCDKPLDIPHCANTTAPPSGGDCFKDGENHRHGSKWDTRDCKEHCECLNGGTNNMKCEPITCSTASPNCDIVHIPGFCCPVLHNCRPIVDG